MNAQTLQLQGARPAQEDAVLALPEKGIFMVADGFGGPAPGARAAQVACESIRGFLVKEAGDHDATLPFILRTYFSLAGNVLFNALIHANRKVKSLNQGKNVHERGGASILAAYLDGSLLAIASVGVCGAVLFREGKFRELVTPRTYRRLLNPFEEDPEATFSNVVVDVPLMALGMSDDLEPEICEVRVRPGDWLLLHTDGLPRSILSGVTSIQGEAAFSRVSQLLQERQLSDNTSISLVLL